VIGYDYDAAGTLTNRRNVVDAMKEGLPAETWCDGMCVDTEGGIWSARSV
jgi:sugar lactone lactonase YvrE